MTTPIRRPDWGHVTSTGLPYTSADIVDAHFDACRTTYLELLADVGLQAGWHVLDAGTGTGRFLPHLAELVGDTGRLTAIDLAPENVALVRARYAGLPALADVAQCDVTDLPYPDDTFDAAWCANTTQYLDDDQLRRALAELRRVVRGDGLVAVKDLDATTITAHPGPPFLFTDYFRAAAATSGYAGNLLRTRHLYRFLRAAGLADVRQRTLVSEHFAPFPPAVRAFYGRSCASLAARAGADPDWRTMLDENDGAHWLNDPDGYVAEGAVLAVGTVGVRYPT